MLYGYRGIVLEKDFLNEVYRIHEGEDKFNKTVLLLLFFNIAEISIVNQGLKSSYII